MIILSPILDITQFSSLSQVKRSNLIKQSLVIYLIIAILAGLYLKYYIVPLRPSYIDHWLTEYFTLSKLPNPTSQDKAELIKFIHDYAYILPLFPLLVIWFSRITEAFIVSYVLTWFNRSHYSYFNLLLSAATYAEILTLLATAIYQVYPAYLFTLAFFAIAYLGFKQIPPVHQTT